MENDSRACTYLAETGYDVKFGARSIEQEVFKKIQMDVVGKYLAFAMLAYQTYPSDPSEKEQARDMTFTVKYCQTDDSEPISVSLDSC